MEWEGHEAAGLPDMGMQMLRGDETPQDIIRIAYSQEHGLAIFYLKIIPLISDSEVAGVFKLLADVEEIHKRKLFEIYKVFNASADQKQFEKSMSGDMMEGGWQISEFIAQHKDSVRTPADAITIAMMIEAQASDLYLRYADKSKDADVRKILFDLANEEKAHLKRLGKLMEEKYVFIGDKK